MALRLNIVNTSRQQFNFTADGIELQVNLDFNTVANAWFLGLRADGAQVFQGRKLVSRIDLANEFTAGTLYAKDASNNSVDVGYDDLVNGNSRLYYLTQAEIAAIGVRNIDTLEDAVELPANFVDGGTVGVPIEQFNALQEKCDVQAQTLVTFGNALNAAGEDITQLINRVQGAEEALNEAEGELADQSNLIDSLLVSVLLKEVAFSFAPTLSNDTVVARWVSTKEYTLRATPNPTATGVNRGASVTAPTTDDAGFIIRRVNLAGDNDIIGTVVFAKDTTAAVFSIENDEIIKAGELLEIRSGTLHELTGAAFTLQLQEVI